jgi:hydroxyacylglutathione hydrolase
MKVLMNTGGIAATNCFLAVDEPSGQAVLFDAPNDTTGMLLDEAQKNHWEVIALCLTHGHFDHMLDHPLVTGRCPGAKVLIHRLDEPKLQHPQIQIRLFMLPFDIPPRSADGYVEDNQVLRVGQSEIQVLHTPGHAAGHVCYYCADKEKPFLVGGDLIIQGAVGRTDLPDSDPDALMASIRRVMRLPPTTRLLPGHGEPSTLGEELESNPYVQEAMEAR